jgi:hypothetical protein
MAVGVGVGVGVGLGYLITLMLRIMQKVNPSSGSQNFSHGMRLIVRFAGPLVDFSCF